MQKKDLAYDFSKDALQRQNELNAMAEARASHNYQTQAAKMQKSQAMQNARL